MASREITDLRPEVAEKVRSWVNACHIRNVQILIYCTYRSATEQEALYAMGRTAPGRIVTMAPPWTSWHQYRRALDAVPMVNGKPDWSYADLQKDGIPDEPWWQIMVEQAEKVGLEWAGRWKSFHEYVHWQDTGGLTIAQAYRETTGIEMTA